MIVEYRIWLKDRENMKLKMQFSKAAFHVEDILETAHDLMISETDADYICYRIDLIDIIDFCL